MCITTGPAKLSKTKIMSFPLENGRFMFSYVNNVRNGKGGIPFDLGGFMEGDLDLEDFGERKPNENANSMILPIPGEVREEWFYDTSKYNKFLDDIEEFHKPRTRSLSLSKGMASNGVSVFENGMYTVVVSKNIESIKDAINTLPEEKRPEIQDELLNFFGDYYKGFSFVVCCFSGDKEMKAQPIMFEYAPNDPSKLFFPGMDAHDGGAPKLRKQVSVDHCLIAHANMKEALSPDFTQDVPLVLQRPYMTSEETGSRINGDWYLDVDYNTPNFVRTY